MEERRRWFARFAWAVLGYNILVVLWGAFVRATGSGAGCGDHWPLCNGEIVPRSRGLEQVIELSHRLTSSIAGLLVIVLLAGAWRFYPKAHRVRRGAALSMLFILTEGLIGAGLVLFRLVAKDQSVARVWSMSAHLVNTLILIGVLTLTAWWASGGLPLQWRERGGSAWMLGSGAAGMLILGISGAIAALGDTLFPASSIVQGLQQDIAGTAHVAVRLRIFHPAIAIVIGGFLAVLVTLSLAGPGTRALKRWAGALGVLLVLQFVAGVVNVWLLAPVWLQLTHLLLADLVWVSYVLLAVQWLSEPVGESSGRERWVPAEALPRSR